MDEVKTIRANWEAGKGGDFHRLLYLAETMRAEIGELQQALAGLLAHCDAEPDGETDFERAVLKARKLLPTKDTNDVR